MRHSSGQSEPVIPNKHGEPPTSNEPKKKKYGKLPLGTKIVYWKPEVNGEEAGINKNVKCDNSR